ncbi:high affinity sulfate permease [Coprinopsis sp. MPI-PUGE-AT-0042]|nr:high affinity sulfate permease [Coprinopsis sp. MPI-PUGE-AT-0042]
MSWSSAKRLSKRIVRHPEETVPIVSSTAWATTDAFRNPVSMLKTYLLSLFPIIQWLPGYNLGWLTGDLVAGITVGIVVVPQGMSYAVLATLSPEYGLYSSFVGVLLYCLFATSKDVSIGPITVLSLLTAQTIEHVEQIHPGVWSGPEIASNIALISGFIILGMGLLRIGWLVEFIPAPAVSGFMTGSAFTIATTQLPGMMGITGFNTRESCYKVIINTLKGLPRTSLDAAWGLTGLVALYALKYASSAASKKWPRRAKIFFFMSVLRNFIVIVILTLASWLYCKGRKNEETGKYPIKILLEVPSGLEHIQRPSLNPSLLSAISPKLPIVIIVLVLEHIAVSKSFGRLNGYIVDPGQELIAIGVANSIGSVFGAYACTGAFTRSALKSKCGVRTPAAGIATAAVVLIALYALTSAFFWIPSAGLAAIIIHAVADLVASPHEVYAYWRISPLECIIWFAAVFVAIFSSIENAIYASVVASFVLLLIRLARPRDNFLGKVTVHHSDNGKEEIREIFLPFMKNGIANPHLKVTPPAPGVLIYRFEESWLYPNCGLANSAIVNEVKKKYRRGQDMTNVKASDRSWSEYGKSRSVAEDQGDNLKKPLLHAIVLDFSPVSHVDTTSVQALIDVRREVERWSDRAIEFHFAPILSPWIHRALVAGGFGIGRSNSSLPQGLGSVEKYDRASLSEDVVVAHEKPQPDEECGVVESPIEAKSPSSTLRRPDLEPLVPLNTPFFHVDLTSAVRAAESGVNRPADRD